MSRATRLYCAIPKQLKTFAHNYCRSCALVTEDQFQKAVRVNNYVQYLSDRYETSVGARSHMLSGGEKQRISPTQALSSIPDLLILDEVISHPNPPSEWYIRDFAEKLQEETTTLIVAHKPTSILCTDTIDILAKGKITEVNPHKKFIELNNSYTRMWNYQKYQLPKEIRTNYAT